MVPGQHGPGEVVKAPGAGLAAIALPMRLGVVAPVADHRIAAAAGTAHALAPAMLAYQREALGIVQQGREIDQIDGWHDGGGSSHAPVSYSRSRLQARPSLSPAPPSGPHHPERRQEPKHLCTFSFALTRDGCRWGVAGLVRLALIGLFFAYEVI